MSETVLQSSSGTGEVHKNFVQRSVLSTTRFPPVQDAILIDVSAEGQRSGGRAAGGAMPATGNDNV